jgi:hypothetical protein
LTNGDKYPLFVNNHVLSAYVQHRRAIPVQQGYHKLLEEAKR